MDTRQTRTLNGHEFQTFAVAPQLLKHGKTSTRLVRTEHLNSGVQVVADGGETNLHAHTSQDEIWFVLSGAATFYTEGDVVVATLGQHEGLLIPHDAPYWFESSSQENLVILRFGASVPGAGPDRRIDLQQRTFAVKGEAGGVTRPVEYLEAQSANRSRASQATANDTLVSRIE